jgi:hypothetical protein
MDYLSCRIHMDYGSKTKFNDTTSFDKEYGGKI